MSIRALSNKFTDMHPFLKVIIHKQTVYGFTAGLFLKPEVLNGSIDVKIE